MFLPFTAADNADSLTKTQQRYRAGVRRIKCCLRKHAEHQLEQTENKQTSCCLSSRLCTRRRLMTKLCEALPQRATRFLSLSFRPSLWRRTETHSIFPFDFTSPVWNSHLLKRFPHFFYRWCLTLHFFSHCVIIIFFCINKKTGYGLFEEKHRIAMFGTSTTSTRKAVSDVVNSSGLLYLRPLTRKLLALMITIPFY